MVWNATDNSDAIQNAILRAYRAFDRYHEDASFRAWMFKILTNETFAMNRKRGRISKFEVALEPEEFETLGGAAADVELSLAASSWEVLTDALDEGVVPAFEMLTEVGGGVLLMRATGELRSGEISESLGFPWGSVRGTLSRARHKMRDAILRSRRRTSP